MVEGKWTLIRLPPKEEREEAEKDRIIARRYLGLGNSNNYYKIADLSEERIRDVTDLIDKKIEKRRGKDRELKKYNYEIKKCEDYNILNWFNGQGEMKQMLFDNDIDISYYRIYYNRHYWKCVYTKDGKDVDNKFHRMVKGLSPNDKYCEYKLQVDHYNHNHDDNRSSNLFICTSYSNNCNKISKGYMRRDSGFQVRYMRNYKYWDLIGGISEPSFKTEEEAIAEVERRRKIVDDTRVKLNNTQELDELIQYCFDNGYVIQESKLADLDLGYLYWKGIFK